MNRAADYPLNENGIGECMQFIENELKSLHVSRHDLMEALLLSEEVILQLQQYAPQDAEIHVSVKRKIGVPRICLSAPGTIIPREEQSGKFSIDQLGEGSENAIREIMLGSYAGSLKYNHGRNVNFMTIVTGIPERILSTYTILAIFLALIFGALIRIFMSDGVCQWLSVNFFEPIETLFISVLMCFSAPAIFVSIVCCVIRFEGLPDLGERGKKVILSYFLTSVGALLTGMLCFMVFQPGEEGFLASHVGTVSGDGFSIVAILKNILPANIIEPFVTVNALHLILSAVIIGVAMAMSGKRVPRLKSLFGDLDVLCGKAGAIIMSFVPIVVFCSVLNVILSSRIGVYVSLLELIAVILISLVGLILIYCLALLFAARLSPISFLRKYLPTMKSTFLKGSGVSAIPMTMRVCRRRLGIPQALCSFSIPFGALINMDGNCVCLAIVSLFFARIYGVALDANSLIVLFILMLVLSLGAPIAPGTLILCTITLLMQMGIDTRVASLIIGINFILEMLLGVVNSTGDVVISLIISRRDGTLDLDTFRSKG